MARARPRLRAQTLRENTDKLEKVNALQTARGIDPEQQAVRRPGKPDAAKQGMMRPMPSDVLQDGPLPLAAVATAVAALRPEIDRRTAQKRCEAALAKMQKAGLVRREGGMFPTR